MFISLLWERKVVTKLLTNDISIQNFLQSTELQNDKIKLVQLLVQEVSTPNSGVIPIPYQKFILNICKSSPTVHMRGKRCSPDPEGFLSMANSANRGHSTSRASR